LKKAPLVATKYTTTSSTMRIPKTQAIARSQPRRFLGAGELTVVSVINNNPLRNTLSSSREMLDPPSLAHLPLGSDMPWN
jgi:hypothetical protein